jgi:hypothetical protein
MTTSSARAVALSPTDRPPPRRASIAAVLMPVMIVAGFLPGLILGVSLGSPPPPSPDRCDSAPDIVACIIQSLD